MGRFVVVARGLYLARHLFTLYVLLKIVTIVIAFSDLNTKFSAIAKKGGVCQIDVV